MKEGNKIYCIKDKLNKHGQIVHKKNHYYCIILIDDDTVWLQCEKDTMPNDYIGYIYSGELYNNFEYLDEYFTSDIKKIRKMKINEIC